MFPEALRPVVLKPLSLPTHALGLVEHSKLNEFVDKKETKKNKKKVINTAGLILNK